MKKVTIDGRVVKLYPHSYLKERARARNLVSVWSSRGDRTDAHAATEDEIADNIVREWWRKFNAASFVKMRARQVEAGRRK